MRIDLYLHPQEDGRLDRLIELVEALTQDVHKLGAKVMANFDALNARIADLEATATAIEAKVDELRAILESDSADQEKVDAITVKVGELEDALQAKAEEKQP